MRNRKHADISGLKFGRLTAVEFVSKDKWRASLWKCKCECGTESPTQQTRNRSITPMADVDGELKSCGDIADSEGISYSKAYYRYIVKPNAA